MIVPENKKHCVWVRIAKNGSTSVEKVLVDLGVFYPLSRIENYRPGQHVLAIDELSKLADVGIDVDDCWIWAVVRDPVDRFISGFRGHTWAQDKTLDGVLDEPPQKGEMSWNDPRWARIRCNRLKQSCECERCHDSAWRHLFRSQTYALTVNGELRFHHLVKFSRLWTNINLVLQTLRLPPRTHDAPHRNASNRKRPELTEEQIARIEELFADDFKNFRFKRCSKRSME